MFRCSDAPLFRCSDVPIRKLHFRGDTTTSRRVYDAVAAGCIPVIISDGVHLPFQSHLHWPSFSIIIDEKELLKGPDHAFQIFQRLLEDERGLRERQDAVQLASHDLIYGFGAPENFSKAHFKSHVTDHILEEAFDLAGAVGKFRQFPDSFGACSNDETAQPKNW